MNLNNWYEEVVLDNRLKLWYKHVPTLASSLHAIVDAGSRNDGEYPGLAHFVEHILFRETKNLPNGIKCLAAEEGININAGTDKKTMCLKTENILNISSAFTIIREALMNPLFLPNTNQSELSVVKNEIKRSHDNSIRMAMDIARAHLASPPYNTSGLGFVNILDKITSKTMQDFHAAMFAPERTTLCYIGALPLNQIIDLCNASFWNWGFSNNKWLGNYKMSSISSLNVKKDTKQTLVSFNFVVPPTNSHKTEAIQILKILLVNNLTGRFYKELREKEGLCYEFGGKLISQGETSDILFLYAVTSNETVRKTITKINTIIENLANGQELVTQKELDIGKNCVKAMLFRCIDNPVYQINLFKQIWQNKSISETMQAVEALTIDDINKVANKYLLKENCQVEPKLITIGR